MPTTIDRNLTVVLLGNPNTGKSTLFSALAGIHQRVGNYPGVTVEKKIGHLTIDQSRFTLVDLPGTYSLTPRSQDEMVTVDVLLGRRDDVAPPDAVICIVDASNLERNFYLVSQVLEMNLPVIVALNMIDVAAQKGLTLDLDRLRKQLAVPVVEIQANRKIGLNDLTAALSKLVEKKIPPPLSPFPEKFQSEVALLAEKTRNGSGDSLPRYLVERLLLDTSGYLQQAHLPGVDTQVLQELESSRLRLAEAGMAVPGIEAISRYQWVGQVLEGVVTRPQSRRVTGSDRLDEILTHKVWGTLAFIVLMLLIFQSIFAWAGPAMDGIEGLIGRLGDFIAAQMPEGALRSLLVHGIIAGVGGVLVFLPQIFILFFFIAVLEDCGYMARAAYLMDKLMARVGLSGKSFIPLLSSFACAIPGIMAARVIENRRDRLVTILVAPLMSCSARLPVYTLLIGAFIPGTTYLGGWIGLQGLTMFLMYLIGIVAAILMALVLKKTILRGETPPFVMELPSYKIPSLHMVIMRMLDRGWAFVRRAGTLIFSVTVLVWAVAYFPHGEEVAQKTTQQYQQKLLLQETGNESLSGQQIELDRQQQEELSHLIAGAYLQQSILGRLGHWIEPAVKPLGWDWRIGCAVIASFPAREVVIGTMGVIYNLGQDQDEESQSLREKLQTAQVDGSDRLAINVPVALSIMVFFALCAQCAATLVVIRRETNSWAWPVFTFVYMTTLAYLGAWATFQLGRLLIT